MSSKNEWRMVKSWVERTPRPRIAAAVAIALTASACLSFMEWRPRDPDVTERGIEFDHAFHADVGPLDCAICHHEAPDQDYDFAMPDHNICGVCHDIPPDALEWTEETDVSGCAMCHTRPDYSVDPQERRISPEVIWSHEPHVAAEVGCDECHVDPDRPVRRPVPDVTLKDFCMNCHDDMQPFPEAVRPFLRLEEEELNALLEQEEPPEPLRDEEVQRLLADVGMPPPPEMVDLLDCFVCHTELDKDVIPTERAGRPLPHDNPYVWERIHGREYQADAQFCDQCHVSQEDCDTCHSMTAPQSHTLSWRRKTHGLRATWDRQSCAVCHEEDSCIRCHQSSSPRSHRAAGWDSPINRHCMSCHYPPEQTSCTVCHEDIQHRRAMPSPHARGLYPANCALCHPGGLPHRAPHPMNSTVGCAECHR